MTLIYAYLAICLVSAGFFLGGCYAENKWPARQEWPWIALFVVLWPVPGVILFQDWRGSK